MKTFDCFNVVHLVIHVISQKFNKSLKKLILFKISYKLIFFEQHRLFKNYSSTDSDGMSMSSI